MEIITLLLIVLGLTLFEVVNSVDNAVINAEVLQTMQPKARNWFLSWGILIAVFVIRGLLPWIIVWATAPQLGMKGSLVATFSNDASVREAVEKAAPNLLIIGGTFLVLLFFHWLFMEQKHVLLKVESFFRRHSLWFYTVAALILLTLASLAKGIGATLAYSATVGSTIFFITHGFKESAEREEKKLRELPAESRSDTSKILYLEVIDAVFSIDGVLGAFAFTLSVPIILIGNGLGAIIVRQLTVGNIERITQYKYLKNGAMYSVLVLGFIMIFDALGYDIPSWLSPIVTFVIIGYFFWRSAKELRGGLISTQ